MTIGCLGDAARRMQRFTLLGRLVANVSHEIRTPLSALSLHVELLEEEMAAHALHDVAEIGECFQEIRLNLERLEALVEDCLLLLHTRPIQRDVQDLGAAVQGWTAEWHKLAAARGVTVRSAGIETLGSVAFHAHTLRRALVNLLLNALDAMPGGGTLTLTGERTQTRVAIHMRDTGCGIAAAQLRRIFEPLYTTKAAGTGLGLYIVQEIVTAHAGQVTVQSEHGQGTTFTIALPITMADTAGTPHRKEARDHRVR